MPQYTKPSLATWLGDRLHKALKLYFYNRNTGLHTQDPFAPLHAQLSTHFRHYRLRYGVRSRNLHSGWTEYQVRWWVMGSVKRFVKIFNSHSPSWFKEEWPLDLVYMDEAGKHITHLGEPDIVFYSTRLKAYVVMDFKTADDNGKYVNNGRPGDIKKWDKLLGYAYGAKQKLRLEYGWYMKPVYIAYVVFPRQKVRKGRMPNIEILTEYVRPQRLYRWKKRFLKRKAAS